jgi:hypothetical protein
MEGAGERSQENGRQGVSHLFKSRLPALLFGLTTVAVLAGCAAGSQSATRAEPAEPDCSFRSASTCWTLSGRFPRARIEAGDSIGKQLREQSRPVLATRPDTSSP